MTESSLPPIPNRTSTAAMLDTARSQYAAAVRDHNVLATEIRAFQKTLADQQAQSTAPHAAASKVLSEEYQRAIADTQAAINARLPRLKQLKATITEKQGLVSSLENTLAQETALRKKQQQSQPRTDNQGTTTKTATSTAVAPATGSSAASASKSGAADEVTYEGEIVVTGKRFQELEAKDHRVRLSAFPGQEDEVYGPASRTDNVLFPLHATQGLLFPYTPTIQQSQDTSWQSSDLEHANYDILSFQKSSSANISLNAKFTAQNQREAEYMFAAIHFLRTVSKAYFGEKDADQFTSEAGEGTNAAAADAASIRMTRVDGKAGLPPPVLLLSGYGTLMFNNIRCVVKSHSWSFDENADMIRVRLPVGETVWLPPMLQISISLAMQSNTDDLRETFSLDDFRTGKLLRSNRKGWF